MKAAVVHSYGSYENIRIDDIPEPTISDKQILVKVNIASVNPIDWKIRKGKLKFLTGNKFPKIIGSECAAEVVKVGAKVKEFKIGDRVIGSTFSGCCSEFAVLDKNKAVKIFTGIDYKQA